MATNEKSSKLTLIGMILMIFTSVFGFNNMPRSFYLMGYAAIPWYILSGITFFVPFAFMMAEFGSAFKSEKGGIYSWMEKSVGAKYAFVGTFMWYASYVVWMVNICSSIWIVLSNAIFGKDTTATWTILGLKSTQTLGILGVIWIVVVTFTASKGLKQISKITAVGGIAVILTNVFLIVGALIVLIANHGHFAQAVMNGGFTVSPNPTYQNPLGVLSFLVFALFAYGGIEVVSGLVDEVKNPEKNFPKGIILAATVIVIGYSLGILLCGMFTNWSQVLSSSKVHMGNVSYVVMQNLGYQLGVSFGLGQAGALSLGAWIARIFGVSMFLTLTGAFFTLSYAPLKQIIEGTPKGLWPGKMGEVKDGMPKVAMWVQCGVVIVFVIMLTVGGDAAAKFFTILVNMTNVAMTIPYMFIAGAFAPFKKNTSIAKPFTIFKSYKSSLIWTIIVVFTVGFANFFTIIQPAMQGDMATTIWMIVGPIFFAVVSLLMYSRYEKKSKVEEEKIA
jgi:amino acid transporter